MLYDHDGEGRRKTETGANAVTTEYVYDAKGSLMAKYSSGGPVETGLRYLTADHLGRTRVVTNEAGAVQQRLDYFPFGETISAAATYGNRNSVTGYGGTSSLTQEFTGKERGDAYAEGGLDYFGARYFSGAQGRWTGADWSAAPEPVPYADLENPQSINLYAYGRNNPLSYRDLDGHCTVDGEQHGKVRCAAHAIGFTTTKKEDKDNLEQIKQLIAEYDAHPERRTLAMIPIGPPGPAVGAEAAELAPYGEGGGHHVPAKSAFKNATGYNTNTAPAIPALELERLGVNHALVTGAQQTLYRAFAQTGRAITWADTATIETQALVRGGMEPAAARVTVQKAIDSLKASGVSGPTRIPWGR